MRRSRAERGFSVALGLFAMVLATYLFLQSPFFRLERIYVSGTEALSSDDIMTMTGLKLGQNLFDVDMAETERRLQQEPIVKSARVSRRLPSGLQVHLVERQAVAAIGADGGLWAIDADARVLAPVSGTQSLVVIVLPAETLKVVPGAFLDDSLLRAGLGVALDLPHHLAIRVWEIQVMSLEDITLQLRDDVKVRLGAWRDIKKKIDVLSSLIRQADAIGTRPQLIDVSHVDKPIVR